MYKEVCPCSMPRPCVDPQMKKKTNEQHKREHKIMASQILSSNQEGWLKFREKSLIKFFFYSISQSVTDFSYTSCYKSQQLPPSKRKQHKVIRLNIYLVRDDCRNWNSNDNVLGSFVKLCSLLAVHPKQKQNPASHKSNKNQSKYHKAIIPVQVKGLTGEREILFLQQYMLVEPCLTVWSTS